MSAEIIRQFNGFLHTSNICNEVLEGLTPYFLPLAKKNEVSIFDLKDFNSKTRLGNRIEQFVFCQLEKTIEPKYLVKNLQIIENGITQGEIDLIISSPKETTHVEIVYKFYLFDPEMKGSEINKWIGPNRKDSLINKIEKLTQKQLPLLKHPVCQSTLSSKDINITNVSQKVLFLAQLYLPYQFEKESLYPLNDDCLTGYYINEKQLKSFNNCSFYLPVKMDWLIPPHDDVSWLDYASFCTAAQAFLINKMSPLFWVKDENNKLTKLFLTWW